MKHVHCEHVIVAHPSLILTEWLSLWLERDFAVETTTVHSLEALRDALAASNGGIAIVDHILLVEGAARAQALLAEYADVPVLVLDDHADATRDELWRRRNTQGCVSATTLESRLSELIASVKPVKKAKKAKKAKKS